MPDAQNKLLSHTMRIELPLEEAAAAQISPRPFSAQAPLDAARVGTEAFQSLFQSVYDAAMVTSLDATVLDVNFRAEEFFRAPRDQLVAHSILEYISGSDASLLSQIESGLHDDRFVLIQGYCPRHDGSYFPAEIAVNRLQLGKGVYLCFFFRDKTLRQQAEARLLTEHHAIQNARVGIAVTDNEFKLDYVNTALLTLWGGEDRQAVLEKHIASFFTDEADVASLAECFSARESWEGELHGLRLNGTGFVMQLAMAPNLDADGECVGAVFSILDISERKRTEEVVHRYQDHLEDLVAERTHELQGTNEKLEQEIAERKAVESRLRDAISRLEDLDRNRREFVSNVSHELKTPLSSMRYAIDNLLSGVVGQVPERIQTYLDMLREDADRLRKTIEDILDLSRLEARRIVLNPMKLSFGRFVDQAVESLRVQAEMKSHTLVNRTRDVVAFAECDPQKMTRVILNLVQNAIKYTPDGGQIEVDLQAQPERELVEVQIRDTGIGIEEENLPRVTERFFRVGEHIDGTGLGLAIAKDIAELHGGSLQIASPVPGHDKGTEVRLLLPAAPPPTVLAADDNEQVRLVLNTQLTAQGYEVILCENGQQVFDVLAKDPVDVLIIDLMMPIVDGINAIARIKADHNLRLMPIVVITGGEIDHSTREILEGFSIPALPKPWKAEELINCLEQVIFGRHYLSG